MGRRPLTREEALEGLRQCKPDLERRYGVTRLGIFGSLARGESSAASDVDIVSFRRRMNGYLKARILAEAVYV